jgi:hypothetical protein
MKRLGLSLFCLVLSTTVLPLASVSASQAPVSPGVCAGNGGAGIVFKTDTMSCPASRCTDDSECWAHCTQAISAACVSGACQYTLPGGTGGGTGGGQCPLQTRCIDDTDCSFPSFGVQGTCVSGACQC